LKPYRIGFIIVALLSFVIKLFNVMAVFRCAETYYSDHSERLIELSSLPFVDY